MDSYLFGIPWWIQADYFAPLEFKIFSIPAFDENKISFDVRI